MDFAAALVEERHAVIVSASVRLFLLAGFATMHCVASAAERPAIYDSGTSEAPELGVAGNFHVGTRYRSIVLPQRVVLTERGAISAERTVGLRLWYPAVAGSEGVQAVYRHRLTIAAKPGAELIEQGKAFENALPAKGRFPLVVISHGFGGWSEHLSRLGEHLASRGYVVASIDHEDTPFDTLPGFMMAFGNVLISRSLDQRQVIQHLVDPEFLKKEPVLEFADKSRIALIGYSMGGFGALATAGAKYDHPAKPFSALPPAAKAQAIDADPLVKIQGLVLIAPWGGQPDNRAWAEGSLASVSTPTLFISGNQDDIVDFDNGVRWLFGCLIGADRHLLIYREARHNIAGNPADLGENPAFAAIGYAREPVWRQDRLNQINQHFVTAFLDSVLKKDASRRRYLDVPTAIASESRWPVAFGQTENGAYAGDGQPEHWRGFQRRWVTGLELHHLSADQKGKQ